MSDQIFLKSSLKSNILAVIIKVEGSDDDNYGSLERLQWSESITERTNPISLQHACDVDESA